MNELKPATCSCGADPTVEEAGTIEVQRDGATIEEYPVYAVYCPECEAFIMPKRTKDRAIVAWNNGEREA